MIELKKEVIATTIPYGQKTTLPKGAQVEITQELGGSFTVLTDFGLLRIEGKDSDALGRESATKVDSPVDVPADASGVATKVWDALKTCYDPEIPVNIVDLGLVYDCAIEQPEGAAATVQVKMTLTAPGCGMGPTIAAEARQKVMSVDGVGDAAVDLVWDPPWNQAMISEAGKMKLGLI